MLFSQKDVFLRPSETRKPSFSNARITERHLLEMHYITEASFQMLLSLRDPGSQVQHTMHYVHNEQCSIGIHVLASELPKHGIYAICMHGEVHIVYTHHTELQLKRRPMCMYVKSLTDGRLV